MTESNFEVDIKEFLKKIEKEKQTLDINELNTFISAHKGQLNVKKLLEQAKKTGVITDSMRRTNKTQIIKQLYGPRSNEYKNIR